MRKENTEIVTYYDVAYDDVDKVKDEIVAQGYSAHDIGVFKQMNYANTFTVSAVKHLT